MDPNLVITLVALAGNLLLGWFTLSKNSRSSTNRFFFIFNFFLGSYLLVNYLSQHQSSSELTHFWVNILMAVVPFLNAAFFLLVHTFPSHATKLRPSVIVGIILATLVLVPASLASLVFTDITKTSAGTNSIPGPAMIYFMVHMVLSLGGGLYVLIRKFLHSQGVERKQLLLLLVGTAVLYGCTLATNFIAVLLFNSVNLIFLLPMYSLFFSACVSYAIVKHKFLDMNWLVARAISYTILVLVTGLLYTIGVLFIGRYVLGLNLELTYYQQLILLLLTFFIAVSFQRVEQYIQRITISIFYRGRYDIDTELAEITQIVASTFEMDELVETIKKRLDVSVRSTLYSFIIFLRGGPIQYPFSMSSLHQDDFNTLQGVTDLVNSDSVEEGPLKQFLRNRNVQIVLPLMAKQEVVGFVLLGDKQSGESYSDQDLQFLRILSDTLAVAFENARSYLEIKKFNVTLQREIETATKELRSANTQLKDLDKLKDEFVSLASHELRTPMAAIKGSISTILEGYAGEISGDARDFLTAAYNENDRLIRLVNNLLNTSRIETGRLNFSLSKFNLNTVIEEVVHNMQIAVKEKQIFLRQETTGQLPEVVADEDKIKEVIINLIGNAIKFTSQGGITIKTEVKDQMIVCSVQDTGTGIHQEDFELLFKKFSQVKRDQKYTKTYGGTGLGLYLSQKIIEGLGGKIWLESEVGKGTTFYFTLPFAT